MRSVAFAFLFALGACAAPKTYMGVDLRTEPASDVQLLARAARSGIKPAQLELGRRFEDGRGVPEDADRACRLYAAAAATTGGTIYVYSPPVRKGGAGRVIPITTPVSPGLTAARERLASLKYRLGAAGHSVSPCPRDP